MHLTRRSSLSAATVLFAAAALTGCVTMSPAATPPASIGAIATPIASVAATTASTAIPATAAVVSAAPSVAASVPASVPASPTTSTEPSLGASPAGSQLPVTTPVPGSSLDASLSDAGVAGRITIVSDTRPDRIGTADHSGTSEILGRAADGSDCSYSLSGDSFTAVAWYDDAPDGMLHQMAVSVSSDQMPANDGEQRSAISDGRVYADFVSESGFGTAYSGDATEESNGGTSTIDAMRTGDTLVFTFTGTTWDDIDFSGQMICTGITD